MRLNRTLLPISDRTRIGNCVRLYVFLVDSFSPKKDENVENAKELKKIESEQWRTRDVERERASRNRKILNRGDGSRYSFSILKDIALCVCVLWASKNETFSQEHRQNNKINIFLKTCMMDRNNGDENFAHTYEHTYTHMRINKCSFTKFHPKIHSYLRN